MQGLLVDDRRKPRIPVLQPADIFPNFLNLFFVAHCHPTIVCHIGQCFTTFMCTCYYALESLFNSFFLSIDELLLGHLIGCLNDLPDLCRYLLLYQGAKVLYLFVILVLVKRHNHTVQIFEKASLGDDIHQLLGVVWQCCRNLTGSRCRGWRVVGTYLFFNPICRITIALKSQGFEKNLPRVD